MEVNLHYYGYKVTEEAPFEINRPEGSFRYIFFHFTSFIKVIDDDGVVHAHKPGTIILFSPGTKQHFYVDDSRLNHDYLDFTIDEKDFFNVINLPMNTFFNPFMSEEIKVLFTKIINEKKNNRADSKYLISNYISEFFINVSRKINKKITVRTDESNRRAIFEELRLTLYQKPKENTVIQMAKSRHYSLSYFNSLYKKHFNVTPVEDLNNARVEYIKKHIAVEPSISVLCSLVGFTSEEYFYRWFKKYFGMTPKEYLNASIE